MLTPHATPLPGFPAGLDSAETAAIPRPPGSSPPRLACSDPFRYLRRFQQFAPLLAFDVHFLQPSESTSDHRVVIDGRELLSYSSYNYLGYSGDPRVSAAAKSAIDRYGTSVSASRLVAGERPLHRELEREIAALIGAEDSLVFVSGHATNVTALGCLVGPKDLVLFDVLSHNSIQQGIRLSGAKSLPFPHNNVQAIDTTLARQRSQFERVLIVTEGVFSMDGDIAPIPALCEVKRRHNAFLMVDEAHSLGVLGRTGRGVVEHFGLEARDVDLWMGTLSKTLASCGGYLAGDRELIESLRYGVPGFIYSCGITPPNAAAALESLRWMQQEPDRVSRLQANARYFREQAGRAGFDTGLSTGTAVVPIVLGSSLLSLCVAHDLFERGVLVHPLFYPVVPERSARLRFFLTAMHTPGDVEQTVQALSEALRDANAG